HYRQVHPLVGRGRETGQFKGQRRRFTPVDQARQGGAEKYGNRKAAVLSVTRANRPRERFRISSARDAFQIVLGAHQAFGDYFSRRRARFLAQSQRGAAKHGGRNIRKAFDRVTPASVVGLMVEQPSRAAADQRGETPAIHQRQRADRRRGRKR